MKKKEWMILGLAIIIALIILILIVIFSVMFKSDSYSKKETKKELKTEVEEIIYEPIEYNLMDRIEKSFLEKYNVIEIMDAHKDMEPEINFLISSGVEGQELEHGVKRIVESYIEGQTRKVANEVLFEYVEAYNSWEVEHLIRKANNKEKIEVLYLYELRWIKNEGISLNK